MATLNDHPILARQTLAQFEAAMPLDQRLPERSVLDVFTGAAARQPERTAITMLMTGAPDEQPRRVNYAQRLLRRWREWSEFSLSIVSAILGVLAGMSSVYVARFAKRLRN